MSRILSIAVVAVALTACGEEGKEASFVSEAVAAPSSAPDYGWRTNIAPDAVPDGTVKEYD